MLPVLPKPRHVFSMTAILLGTGMAMVSLLLLSHGRVSNMVHEMALLRQGYVPCDSGIPSGMQQGVRGLTDSVSPYGTISH